MTLGTVATEPPVLAISATTGVGKHLAAQAGSLCTAQISKANEQLWEEFENENDNVTFFSFSDSLSLFLSLPLRLSSLHPSLRAYSRDIDTYIIFFFNQPLKESFGCWKDMPSIQFFYVLFQLLDFGLTETVQRTAVCNRMIKASSSTLIEAYQWSINYLFNESGVCTSAAGW